VRLLDQKSVVFKFVSVLVVYTVFMQFYAVGFLSARWCVWVFKFRIQLKKIRKKRSWEVY